MKAAADPRVARIERLISTVLRVGVLVSLGVILVGSLAALVRHPDYLSSTLQFHRLTESKATFPRTPSEILKQALHLEGQGLIMTGILLLIATPVVRVAVSVVLFVYRRERAFVLMALVVLALLLTSFTIGRAG